jgi:hypothetical protein
LTNHLTTIAAIPMGGGYLASLPAEKNEQPTALDWERATADLAFDSFIDWSRIAIDLGPIGGDGA